MIIDHINLNHLRIFQSVYRTQSMTTAAGELHLTQSGVSQHIKAFEDMLGVKLFDRIKKRLIPTRAAATLYERCSSGLSKIEEALSVVQMGDKRLAGRVNFGIPIEFGNNMVIPRLAEFAKIYPMVRFHLKMGFASEMNQGILRGDLDFAFVDDFVMDKSIAVSKVCDEILDLCVAESVYKEKGQVRNHSKYYETLDYVDYQEGEPVLRMWFHHHLGPKIPKMNVKATVMDVQGMARFIVSGLGAGVLPGHLIQKLEDEGHKLYRYKGKGAPLKNAIRVAHLKDRTQSAAAATLLDWLKTSLGTSLKASAVSPSVRSVTLN